MRVFSSCGPENSQNLEGPFGTRGFHSPSAPIRFDPLSSTRLGTLVTSLAEETRTKGRQTPRSAASYRPSSTPVGELAAPYRAAPNRPPFPGRDATWTSDLDNLPNIDWCKVLVDEIRRAVISWKSKKLAAPTRSLTSCILFCIIFYLDNI